MKHALVALLLLSPLITSAQKQNLYTDAGLSLAYMSPGLSATYDYNVSKHIGLGAGLQGYGFYSTFSTAKQFTPALFADFRFRIRPGHVSEYFILADLGMDFYKHNDDYRRSGENVYTVVKDNGVYFGLGLGYFHRTTARGWGWYTTLKLINNFYKVDELNTNTGAQRSLTLIEGTAVISAGFRFGNDSKASPARTKVPIE